MVHVRFPKTPAFSFNNCGTPIGCVFVCVRCVYNFAISKTKTFRRVEVKLSFLLFEKSLWKATFLLGIETILL